jgi:pSer/pThr/pTyr-binding forkhead associated (FHA) protein
MLEVTLSIDSPQGATDVPLKDDPLTIGRTDAAHFVIEGDTGLSRRHATIRREHGRVFIFDEHSTNGSFVNGAAVAPEGRTLADGDVIRIGNSTTIRVRLEERAPDSAPPVAAQAGAPPTSNPAPHAAGSNSLPLKLLLPLVAVVVLLLGAVGFGLYQLTRKPNPPPADETAVTNQSGVAPDNSADEPTTTDDDELATSPASDASPASSSSNNETTTPDLSSISPATSVPSSSAPASDSPLARTDFDTSPVELVTAPTQGTVKLYQKMSDAEKREFIKQRAQKVALMMDNRPYAFSPDALDEIKFWLDAFARRIGNNQTGLWRGDTRHIFERARANSPVIIQAFKQARVPPVIGLYIPFIETEYTNITTNNVAGAAGLFQFLGPTAEAYDVPASERTNISRMAPAAAKYFRDNIMRFGNDSMSVALSIAGYNRNPESVMRDLRNVLNEQDNTAKERTFWTLIANQGKLDHAFQSENKNYVPRFFAAAIMGETPWAFGLDMRPLSTYTQPDNQTQPRAN